MEFFLAQKKKKKKKKKKNSAKAVEALKRPENAARKRGTIAQILWRMTAFASSWREFRRFAGASFSA